MLTVKKDVWLMTAFMVTPIVGVELLGLTANGRLDGFLVGNWLTMPSLAGVVTALTWSWLIARRASVPMWQGVIVGALCATLILAVPTVVINAQIARRASRPDEGMVTEAAFLSLGFFWLAGAPLGALFGAITIGARRSWGRGRDWVPPVPRAKDHGRAPNGTGPRRAHLAAETPWRHREWFS